MVEWGAISRADLHLLQRADTPQQAFELLKAHLTKHHLEPATVAGDQGAGHREDGI